jgi:hypothetical protein
VTPRRSRAPANGIATYRSRREDDFETWHDKHPSDGHWLNHLLMYGLREMVTTEDERTHGALLSTREMNERFRAQCVARGFDPDSFRVVLRRPKAASAAER